MGVVEDFPYDPFVPSLRYAATCQLPIYLPWGAEPIKLGTTLSVSRSANVKPEFTNKSAFSETSIQQSRLVFTSSSGGDVTETETSGSASSSEHVDFTISGQIGGSVIGASGRAHYEKQVSNDSSSMKSSFRSTYRSGKVAFLETPKLSSQALNVLRSAKDPQKAFEAQFGSYYVAAYVLGGSNANMLGSSTASSFFSKDLKGSFTVKVLFIKKTFNFESHDRSASESAVASLSAFDTLEKWDITQQANEGHSYANLIQAAAENSSRGWSIAQRLDVKARALGLEPRAQISWAKCEDVCRAGMVVELILMPYAGLREYVSAVLAGPLA